MGGGLAGAPVGQPSGIDQVAGVQRPRHRVPVGQCLRFRVVLEVPPEDADAQRFPGLHLSWAALRGPEGSTAVHYRLAYADAQQLRPYQAARWSQPPIQLGRQSLQARLGQVAIIDFKLHVDPMQVNLLVRAGSGPNATLDLFRAALQESVAAQANVERVAPRRKRERGQRKASGAARKT